MENESLSVVKPWNNITNRTYPNRTKHSNRTKDPNHTKDSNNACCFLQVLGLQRVTPVQYYRLQSTCMKSYNTSGVPGHLRSSTATTFNAIFYKNDRKINTEIASGTYSSLTWTRLTFQSLQTTRHRRSILGQSLLAILNGQRAQKKYARAIRRKNYRKQVFFVNVDLKDSDVNKKDTLNKLLSHLYYNVMGRRRYHVILFGTVGWEITERMLSSYMKRRRRGSDVYFSLFRRAMANSNYRMKNLVNQIWQTYTKSTSTFKSVLSAVVHTETRNQPTFSTFLV